MDLMRARPPPIAPPCSDDRLISGSDRPKAASSAGRPRRHLKIGVPGHCHTGSVTGRNSQGQIRAARRRHGTSASGRRAADPVTAPDERFPRPRALRHRLARRPRLPGPLTPAVTEARTTVEEHDSPAWFSYTAAGDEVTWSDTLADMLGEPAPRPTGGHRTRLATAGNADAARLCGRHFRR